MARWTILEAGADLVLAVALVWPVRALLRAVLSSIPRRHAVVFLAIPALLAGGQMINDANLTFPLAPWNMHTESYTTDPQFIDYTVERASGALGRLLVAELFPVVGKKLWRRIDDSARALDRAAAGDERPEAAASLDDVLASLVREYDRGHPGDPVRVVRLWDCRVPVDHYAATGSIRRRLMYEYRPR